MSYYICPFCPTVGETWGKLRAHIMGAHPETKQSESGIPKKEDIEQVDEIPEGYKLTRKWGRERDIQEPREEREPSVEVKVPKEIPEEFNDRVKLSLDVHSFPDRLKAQILNVLALHPETHDNPNNFGNLLAHICSTYSGGATYARKIPLVISEVFGQPSAEVPYAWGYGAPSASGYFPNRQQSYGYGAFGGQAGAPPHYEDPITRWINYQIWKESKEEEKTKETKLPSAIETKLAEMERWYKETREDLGTVLGRLDKQERMEEEAKREAQIDELRTEIRAISESKKGGGESDWLRAFLDERDKREDEARKRLEDIIKAQSEKLAEATKEIAEARLREKQAATEALSVEEERRRKYAKELEEHGWSPREKKTDEEILGIAKEQVLPGLISEVRETGKAIRSSVRGGQIPSIPTPETPQAPLTPEQSEKAAEIMMQREEIRRLQEET